MYFLSTRSGDVQVFKVDLESQDVHQVTRLPVGINSFRYSSAGGFLVLSIDVYLDCDDLECTAKKDKEVHDRGENSWIEYDELFAILHHLFLGLQDTGMFGKITNFLNYSSCT